MSGLVFIGLGLHDEKDITLRGLEEARSCDALFLESYTSLQAPTSRKGLEKQVGKPITRVTRKDVEGGDAILAAASRGKAGLLVVGDSMAATTHIDLRLRAEKAGIRTSIVHNASIITAAAGSLGLQSYKFGRSTTLVISRPGFAPESPYDVVAANLAAGNHTLVLLDIDVESGRYMTANEGLSQLESISRKRGDGLIGEDTTCCVVTRVGGPSETAKAGPLKALASMDFGPPLHAIVVPGRLHDVEAEALRILAGLTTLG
ncbi:MAG: diphthine synthase [Euryarchaeota archaeon]|nr:diphthine synthase [Euryarchaeota archaeon]